MTILDEDLNPLVGVNVYNTNLYFSDISDINGQVRITNNSVFPLSIQYLGYEESILSYVDYQSLDDATFVLSQRSNLIKEVILVGRTETRVEDLPYQVERINQQEILQNQSQTSADVLTKSGNIFIQKSQMGGGSPIVRGFEANKLLLVVDGVRLNNAIYRSGHLQNAITIDPTMLDQIEVIYGPGSLGYGSDALGGVIQFKSKDPILNLDTNKSVLTQTSTAVRWSSANSEKHIHADINLGFDRWASLTSISYSDFGDLRIGENGDDRYPGFGLRPEYIETVDGVDQIVQNMDPYVQVGTGYSQLDLLQKIKYQIDRKSYLIGNVQYSRSSDIPRYDQLTDRRDGQLRFAEWYYGPQTRFMASAKYKTEHKTLLYDQMMLIAAYQYIEEDRIDRSFGSISRSYQEEDLDIMSTTIDFSKAAIGLKWSYGLDMQYNILNSQAYSKDINTEVVALTELTRYPDGDNSMLYSGAYISTKKNYFEKKIKLHAGLRYSYNQADVQYVRRDLIEWPDRYYNSQKNSNTAWTWSFGTQYNPRKDLRLQLLIANAFRSPNIDDISKIRIKGGEVTIPNLDLIPERSTSVELNINKDINQTGTTLVASVFYTELQDVIIRVPYNLPSGEGILIDGPDTLITTANVNATEGYIYGYSLEMQQEIIADLSFKAQYTYTYGRSQSEGEVDAPLAHIPPGFGSIKLFYEQNSFDLESVFRFHQTKDVADFEPSTDNLDQATLDGSPAWNTLNFYGNYRVKNFTFSLGLENILDRHYRSFASGVSGAGRNIIITARYQL